MNSKSKITSKEFITIFLSFFVPIFSISIMVALLPFAFTYGSSKFFAGIISLGITMIATIIVILIMRSQYDINELPAFKTTLKLIGIISLFSLIVVGPLFAIQFQNQLEKFIGNIFKIICWLFVIGISTYIMLKIGNYKINNPSHL